VKKDTGGCSVNGKPAENEFYLSDPVQWSEGMLLSSQHFQQNHLYWESQSRYHLEMFHPFYWGFIDLRIDETRLLEGVVCVEYLHAVMPDGLIVQYNAKVNSCKLEIDLKKEIKETTTDQIIINLVVPVRTDDSASSASCLRRFESIEGRETVDENTGENPVCVNRLQPILKLVAEQYPAKKYVALPMLKGIMNSGKIAIQTYYPPMLRADAIDFVTFPSLKSRIEGIDLIIRKKAVQVSEMLRRGGEKEKWSLYEKMRLTLNSFAVVLPLFDVVIRSGYQHPFELYKVIVQTAGALSVIDSTIIPLMLPVYNHNDIENCFETCMKEIERICKSVNIAYSTLAIEADKQKFFNIDISCCIKGPSEYFLFEIVGSENQSRKNLERWVDSCRIGTEDVMESLRKQRHTGATRKVMVSDNQMQIHAAPGNVLMAIDKKSEYIKGGKNILIQCTDSSLYESGPSLIYLHIPSSDEGKEGNRQ
jgi:type VI secretion system protein ImpJ